MLYHQEIQHDKYFCGNIYVSNAKYLNYDLKIMVKLQMIIKLILLGIKKINLLDLQVRYLN